MADTISMNSLSLDAARRILAAAEAKAVAMGVPSCICVSDPSGDPIISVRMDGAPRMSADIAKNKAWTVASFLGIPTDKWWPTIESEPALVHGLTNTPRLIVFGGGLPIHIGGALVGAIGVSGGSAEQDREIASAGADLLS
jgi:glc operon protein GlcG